MDLGLHLPQIGRIAGPEALRRVAAHAEDAGFASLWVSDHITFPEDATSRYPYSKDGSFPVPFDAPFLDPISTVAFVAAVTRRVLLGTSVLVLPLRRPVELAKQITSLQALSGERFVLGAGSGWLEEEFVAVGASFVGRGDALEVAISTLRSFVEGTATCAALGGSTLLMEPRPTAAPPLWLGGSGARALARAGRLADAWHAPGGGDVDALATSMAVVRDHAERAGRPPDDVALTTRLGVRPTGVDRLLPRLDALAGIGCTHVVLDPIADDAITVLRLIDELAGRAR